MTIRSAKPDLVLEKEFNEDEGQYYVAYRRFNETTNDYEDAVEYFDLESDADDFIMEIEDNYPGEEDEDEDEDEEDEDEYDEEEE